MEWLFRFLDNHGVLEGLGIAFIVFVLLAFALWKLGILKLENPAKQVVEAVDGFCPDPGCREEICRDLGELKAAVTTLIGKVGAVQGSMDVLVQWVKETK